jgi:hypothetical protein
MGTRSLPLPALSSSEAEDKAAEASEEGKRKLRTMAEGK